jgi:hypothetical protein
METFGLPRFLDEPPYKRALFFDPGGTPYTQAMQARERGRRTIKGQRLPRLLPFEAQSHGSFICCLRFAGWVAPVPRKTRFRLLAKLCRAGLITR